MKSVTQVVEANLSNSSFTVDILAHEIGMSRNVFFKKFNSLAGTHPNDFIRDYRLNRAAKLLNDGAHDIAQIAFEVGFEYANYFARCFKDKFGKSPSEYAKSVVLSNA